MSTKVAELTVDELKDLIREIIEDYFEPEEELEPDFTAELAERMKSNDWVDHDTVWKGY